MHDDGIADDGVAESLVAEARLRLAEGVAPGQVFAQLAVGASDVRAVALAICIAIGVPRPEAEIRMGSKDPRDWQLDDDDISPAEYAAEYGDLLERVGTFDRPAELTADQRRIVDLLQQSIAELPMVRSGVGDSYYRAVRRGDLREALVMLSRPERMWRDIATKTYWGRLVAAAEMLGGDGDPDYVEAVQRCRDRLAQIR